MVWGGKPSVYSGWGWGREGHSGQFGRCGAGPCLRLHRDLGRPGCPPLWPSRSFPLQPALYRIIIWYFSSTWSTLVKLHTGKTGTRPLLKAEWWTAEWAGDRPGQLGACTLEVWNRPGSTLPPGVQAGVPQALRCRVEGCPFGVLFPALGRLATGVPGWSARSKQAAPHPKGEPAAA